MRLQVETVLDDIAVRAVKTGMLATAAIVREVAALAAEGRLPHLVVDPVLVSSSGHPLLEPAGVEAYLDLSATPGPGGDAQPARSRRPR